MKLGEKRNKTLSNHLKFLTSVLHMIGDSLSSKYLLCVSMTAGKELLVSTVIVRGKLPDGDTGKGSLKQTNKQTNETSLSASFPFHFLSS